MAGRFQAKYGPWALVAGASEGLGAAFADAIAARGVNLILIARRGDALEAGAASLRGRHGVEARVAALDLARADASDEIARLIADVEVGLGVYNAAFAPVGDFVEQESTALSRVLDVNARGPM